MDNGRLRVRSPSGALTPDLQRRIAENRSALLELLRAPIEDRDRGAETALVPAPQDRHQSFPLTDIQQAYWIGRSSAMEMGGVGCHVYWEIDGRGLDLHRLERGWQRLVEHHDMLRAVFLPDGQQQVLREVPPFRITTVDLGDRDPAAAQAALEELRREMSHRVYDAAQWPLFDIRAARVDGDRLRILLSLDQHVGPYSSEPVGPCELNGSAPRRKTTRQRK